MRVRRDAVADAAQARPAPAMRALSDLSRAYMVSANVRHVRRSVCPVPRGAWPISLSRVCGRQWVWHDADAARGVCNAYHVLLLNHIEI